MFELLAVEPLIDPETVAAAAGAVAGGLTVGRLLVVGLLVAAGVAAMNWPRLAAAWAEAKTTAATTAKSNPAIPQALSVPTVEDANYIGLPLDDLSQGFAYARGMDEIYERQGVSIAERKRRLMAAVDSVCLVVVPVDSPPVAVTPPTKGGAA